MNTTINKILLEQELFKLHAAPINEAIAEILLQRDIEAQADAHADAVIEAACLEYERIEAAQKAICEDLELLRTALNDIPIRTIQQQNYNTMSDYVRDAQRNTGSTMRKAWDEYNAIKNNKKELRFDKMLDLVQIHYMQN